MADIRLVGRSDAVFGTVSQKKFVIENGAENGLKASHCPDDRPSGHRGRPGSLEPKDSTMLYSFVRAHRPTSHVIVAPSNDDAKRIFERFRPLLDDGPVAVQGQLIGWKTTNAGSLGAVFVNPLTGKRTLWALDFRTRQPRQLAILPTN